MKSNTNFSFGSAFVCCQLCCCFQLASLSASWVKYFPTLVLTAEWAIRNIKFTPDKESFCLSYVGHSKCWWDELIYSLQRISQIVAFALFFSKWVLKIYGYFVSLSPAESPETSVISLPLFSLESICKSFHWFPFHYSFSWSLKALLDDHMKTWTEIDGDILQEITITLPTKHMEHKSCMGCIFSKFQHHFAVPKLLFSSS